MRFFLLLLILLLIPVVSADNVTTNQTNQTQSNITILNETVYNPEVLVDQHGNFNRSSILFTNFLKENFGSYIEIRISYSGTNDSVWCQEQSVVRLADGYLYNLEYNKQTMECEGDFKISGDADFSQVLAVDKISDALKIEYDTNCINSRENDKNEIDNLKKINWIYIGIIVLLLLGIVIVYLKDNLMMVIKIEI